MSPQVGARLRPAAYAFVAILGTWLGHGVEYARVGGADGLAAGLAGPLHGYMLPAGAALMVLTLLLGAELVAMVRRTRLRAEQLRRQLVEAFRGRRAEIPVAPAPERLRWSAPQLFAALSAAQLILYLVQENVESALAGVPAPGLAAITGVHWAAPLVHASVAAVLVVSVFLLRRLWQPNHLLTWHAEALLRLLAGRGRARADAWRPYTSRPAAHLPAAACWGRAPPSLTAT